MFVILFATLLTACGTTDELMSPNGSEKTNEEQATEETADQESSSETSKETNSENSKDNNTKDTGTNQDDIDKSNYEAQHMTQIEWENCVESRAYTEEDCIAQDQYYAEGEGQNEPSEHEEAESAEEKAYGATKNTLENILTNNNSNYSNFTYPPLNDEDAVVGYYENGDYSVTGHFDVYNEQTEKTSRREYTAVISNYYNFKEIILYDGQEAGHYTPEGKIADYNE